jgi:uncharacterized membrane protein HdeD (DUF308 family)
MDIELVTVGPIMVRWWAVALRGVAALVFGAFALLVPGVTLLALILWFAAFMAVDGVFAIMAGVGALTHHRHGAALLAEGVLGVLVAALVLAWPGVGIATFVLLAAIWAGLTGAALLWAAVALPELPGRLLMGACAVLSLLLGFLLAAYPMAGALVLAWWLGAYATVSGVLLLGLAFRLRHAGRVGDAA